MEIKHSTCKLCFRRFANGRALSGHMRSHVVAGQRVDDDYSSSSSSSRSESSSDSSQYQDAIMTTSHELRDNPKRSSRPLDEDGQSETESMLAPRSKRASKVAPEHEPVISSVADTTPEEDVAISLMLLSRDKWTKSEQVTLAAAKGRRSKYQCGTCNKVFRSYQALGGHRASHKKTNGCLPRPVTPIQIHEADQTAERVVPLRHECPVCCRVFSSGQALGGHKRSHFAPSAAAATISKNREKGLIDLNLPAPTEDELSAVSDDHAEFNAMYVARIIPRISGELN